MDRQQERALDPADAKYLISQGAEQGYYDESDQFVATGWHDEEGYWFEACGEFDHHGNWEGTGSYDVFDPGGDWYETGHFDENDEWVREEGFYDEGQQPIDLDRELQRNLPGMPPAPDWKPPPPRSFTAPPKGPADKPAKALRHADKYALKQAGKHPNGSKAGEGPWIPKEQEDGRLLRVSGHADPAAETVWNDLSWATIFLAVLVGTVFLAFYKNAEEEVVVVQDSCTSAPCLNGASCDVLSDTALQAMGTPTDEAGRNEGYLCQCLSGWVGPECQIKIALAENSTFSADTPTKQEEAGPALTPAQVGSLVSVLVLACVVGMAWSVAWLLLLGIGSFVDSVVRNVFGCCVVLQLSFGTYILVNGNGFGLLVPT